MKNDDNQWLPDKKVQGKKKKPTLNWQHKTSISQAGKQQQSSNINTQVTLISYSKTTCEKKLNSDRQQCRIKEKELFQSEDSI